MRGVGELRVKESDRIAAMEAGLNANGVTTSSTEDSFTVEGRGADGVEGGATVATYLDHRIAMSFLVMSLATRNPVTIDDSRPVATSFPNFEPLMTALGAEFREGHTA